MRDFNSSNGIEPSSPREGRLVTETQPLSLQERLYTSQEVADRLGVSEHWVRDHATRRSPHIRAVKLGPLLRFRWLDVQAFVENLAIHKYSKHP
jgi:excisionase family DNA binding protein